MIVSCKRLLEPYADLLEPINKRNRSGMLDEDSGMSSSCAVEARRRQQVEDIQEFFLEQPAEKRLRANGEFLGANDSSASSTGVDPGSSGIGSDRELMIRGWAETVVRSLQGCPSVEEAVQRCARLLSDFEGDVQQAMQREEVAESAESIQCLQHTKRVLMRAVHHLAQRCRSIEASTGEVDELRDELEKSQDAQRRLAHANEMLKGHLRLYLDGRM